PGTQDIPGPLQNRNLSYRFLINSFLAEVYLEKAYQANDKGESAEQWIGKAEPRIQEIRRYIGSDENSIVQKFDGMLDFAKGENEKAIRLMYKAYEQSKALDKEKQRSSIDPILCITLANTMKTTGQLGMQREFLEKAIYNNSPIVAQKPILILDYAETIAKLEAWPIVMQMVNNYEGRYGNTQRAQTLKAKAFIAMNEFDKAQQVISQISASEPDIISLKIQLLTGQINQILRSQAQQEIEEQESSTEQTDELAQLDEERNQLIRQLLDLNTETVDVQILISVCKNLIKNERTQEAVGLVDKYLSKEPDNLSLKMLKLQMKEENPLEISPERQAELQRQAIDTLSDPLTKALALSKMYRQQGDYDNALKTLNAVASDISNNSSVLLEKFEIALQQKNIEEAEALLSPLRSQNLDNCEGKLFSAQVEYLKENYPLALRRLDECLAILPLSSHIYYLKSEVYNQQEDYESAIENLRTATKMNPLNSLYARSMASVLFSRNAKLASKVTPQQQAEAQRAIELAMFLNPSDWQLQSVYAETISDTNPDKALKIRQNLLKSHPTGTNALMLGNMALRMAQSERDAAKKTGLIQLAGSSFEQAVAIEPDNEMAKQSYADYLRVTGKSEQVTDFLGDDKDLLWKYYLRNSQFDQALETLNELFDKNPKDTTVLRGLVLTMEGVGDREQVKHYLELLSELDNDKDSQLWVLQKYIDNGFALEAEEKLAGFKEHYPDEKLVLLIEAWIQMEKGQLDEALSLANRYLEIDTENAGAWRIRGRLYRLMNQPQKAISDLQRSKRISPNTMTRLELASVYNEVSNPQGAIGELKEGLNDPQSPLQIRTTLESIYEKTGDFADLEKFYQDTLEKYPQSYFWYCRAGLFYLNQNNFKKAQEFLLKSWDFSIQQNKPDLGVLVPYLESLYKDNQYDKIFSFSSDLIDSPAAPIVYAFMGQAQFKLNQQDEANSSFDKALQKAGPNDRIQNLILEKMLDTVGAEAIEKWYQKQISEDPKSFPAYLMAYQLAQKQEQYNKAIEFLDQCIEILGKEHPGWTTLAIKKGNALISAYIKTGDGDYLNRSIVLFESILEKQPENPSLLNNLAYLLIDNDQKIDTALAYA
ncbi:MAG TPA: tetratricopeptide repeat protein, partial [Alphaproteobacteria bacterium]|nr:tetratricopeptide repeat protein [Alphaproteobacteria bacterium]